MGPIASPAPVLMTKMPDIQFSSSSGSQFKSGFYSIASSISGRTGIDTMPAEHPRIIRPSIIIAGLFSRPKYFEVPTQNIPIDINTMPIIMTPRFNIRSVRRYMSGLSAAQIMPGTAKHIPMKAGEKPYRFMWTAKEGAKNQRHAVTKIYDKRANKKRAMLISSSNQMASNSGFSSSLTYVALAANISAYLF